MQVSYLRTPLQDPRCRADNSTCCRDGFLSLLGHHASWNWQHSNPFVHFILFFFHYFCAHFFFVEEDRDVISITLPPSQYSRTVTITKGSQTTNNVCITENLPFGPAFICLSQQLPTCPNTNTINASPTGATSSLCNECSTRTPSPDIMETRMLNRSAAEVLSINLDALNLGSHASTPENTPSPDLPPPPSHLRVCPHCDWFHVSQEVQKGYPLFSFGWNKLCWVVVFCGQDIGIFHDFWYVFWVV